MSRRWGGRPIGRAIGDTVTRSQCGFSNRSAALASSRTTHRTKQFTPAVLLQKTHTTPDYLRSLFFPGFPVDSSLVSLSPVLPAPRGGTPLVRKYFPPTRVPQSFASFFLCLFRRVYKTSIV